MQLEIFIGIVLKATQNQKKTQKARLWQSDPNVCSNHEKNCGIELPLTWTLKLKFIQNVTWEKKRKKVIWSSSNIPQVLKKIEFSQLFTT